MVINSIFQTGNLCFVYFVNKYHYLRDNNYKKEQKYWNVIPFLFVGKCCELKQKEKDIYLFTEMFINLYRQNIQA